MLGFSSASPPESDSLWNKGFVEGGGALEEVISGAPSEPSSSSEFESGSCGTSVVAALTISGLVF